jgi:acyl carrier protein
MGTDDVELRVEAFLRDQLKVRLDDPGFSRDVDLFDSGYVDSVGFAELLAFLEEDLGAVVPEEDLLSEEFSSVQGVARVVQRLRGASEHAG